MFIQQDLASLRAGNVSLFDVLYLIETLFTANVKASLHYEFGEDLLYLAKPNFFFGKAKFFLYQQKKKKMQVIFIRMDEVLQTGQFSSHCFSC